MAAVIRWIGRAVLSLWSPQKTFAAVDAGRDAVLESSFSALGDDAFQPTNVVPMVARRNCARCGKPLGEIAAQSQTEPGLFCSAKCAEPLPGDLVAAMQQSIDWALQRHPPRPRGNNLNGTQHIRCLCRYDYDVTDWASWRRHVSLIAAKRIEEQLDQPTAPADR